MGSPPRSRPHLAGLVVAVLLAAAATSIVPLAAGGSTQLPPESAVEVSVDGRPIGTGSSRIESCSVAIGVGGLVADPPSTVTYRIAAVAPTVPEESELVLVDETEQVAATSTARTYDMTALVDPLERKPNGYHLEIGVLVDGDDVGAHTYWLGCGEPQTGSPTRVQFAVEWRRLDGSLLATPFDDVLPAGWRSSFALAAESDRGTATCAYPSGSDVLECAYDNPGHGSERPGLVVQGNPRATYTVAVDGVPVHWLVEEATVGEFIGRETCPRGDEHEEDLEPGERARSHDSEPCVHTVVVSEQSVPTSSTTTSTTPASPSTASPSTVAPTTAAVAASTGSAPASGAAVASTGAATLPATGFGEGVLAALGLGLLAAGAVLVGRSRRAMSDA